MIFKFPKRMFLRSEHKCDFLIYLIDTNLQIVAQVFKNVPIIS